MTTTPETVSADTDRRIEKFLYYEALLLDESRFDEWLDLVSDSVTYSAPIVETLEHTSSESVFAEGRLCIFEDNKSTLVKRIEKLKTDYAHSEQPRSRVRHLISNVLVTGAQGDRFEVRSNFLVFQSRMEASETLFAGSRRDVLSQAGNGFIIQSREIYFAHRLMPRSLSILF